MTQVPSIVVDKFGRIQNVQSITIDSTINVTGNYGTGSVNLVSQILQVTSSNAQVINVASSGNTVWVNAVQTSVTSGYYGNNTIIPVLQLDSYGRVLSVTNTAISSSLALSGTSGTGTVSLVNQTLAFTSGNGVNINVSSNTVNVNTAQDIRTTASPTFANVTSSGDSFFNSVRVGNGANNANYSTALGRNALASQTNLGNYNTAGGYNGLTLSTSGTYNSTFGAYGLSSLITGTYNSSFGAQSLASATTSANNSAFGAFSQYNTTIGGNNSSFGTATLFKNTSGTYNSAFGDNALGSATTANNNSAFGSGALKSDNSIGYNSAFGANTLQSSLYGTYNTVMGANAASSMANGAYNTIIGAFAGYAFISGTGSYSNSHTFVGGAAGQSLYTGTSNNTFIGANSGGLVTTGSNNTILGAYRGATTPINATGNNWVVLSDGAGNVRASMDANSNMLVGVTNTQATSNSLYVSNRIGFANTAGASGVSVVYQIYNQSTNSLDTIFG
jgi:hypothetical protein